MSKVAKFTDEQKYAIVLEMLAGKLSHGEICRKYGMRLVGPNCFGIAIPPLGLNATFAGTDPPPGAAAAGGAALRRELDPSRVLELRVLEQ